MWKEVVSLVMRSWYVLAVVLQLSLQIVLGQDCTLDDAQKTRGTCKPFRSCPFAIERYKADIRPKICQGTVVCCPVQETVAEKKCAEWRSYLQTPITFAQDPFPEPFCAPLESQGFIVGGRDARRYEFPHAVALGYGEAGSERYYCGGTIISEEYILTAAHCIRSPKGRPTVVLAGDLTLNRQTSNFRQVISISDWIIHPQYKPPLRYNDVALVKLSTKLELSRYLLPACLPQVSEKGTLRVEAVGWGTLGIGEPQANNLQAVNLTLLGMKECDKFYADAADRNLRLPQGIRRSQLCAYDAKMSGKDTCNGDSGGPLTINEVYQDTALRCLFRVVGVTSFGPRLCGYGTPGVYTKIQTYVPWIEEVAFAGS